MSQVPEYQRREIEQILKELAADPKATLFRIPPIENLLALVKQPKVGVHAPSLTSLERHLLLAHREELAYLLRERCVAALFSGSYAKRGWHKSLAVHRDLDVSDSADWRRRTGQALTSTCTDGRAARAQSVLAECVATGADASGSVARLAAASLRVAPSDEGHIYAAMQCLNDGSLKESRRIHREVLASAGSELIASICWENIGLAYFRAGRYQDAVAAYRSSSASCSERVAPVVFRFSSAVAAGDEHEASEAARIVELAVPVGHSLVGWTEEAVRGMAGTNEDTRHCAEAMRARDDVGEITRRLLNAFLQ